MLGLLLAIPSFADGSNASITTNPSPAVTTKALEVTIKTDDFGSEVYCYTWCETPKKEVFKWGEVNVDAFKMTGSGGTYTFKLADIQKFYSLTDAEFQSLSKLGFIAKTKDGKQTADCFVELEQGRREVYSGGEGTAASPFIIKTSDDLKTLASTPGDWAADIYFRMDADIEAGTLPSSIGTASTPFSAHFDGNGKTISGLTLSATTVGSSIGLFGCVKGGEIFDLGVTEAGVSGKTFVGILAGRLESGKISRCFTTGSAEGSSICVGGLVGENISGSIEDCYSGAVVKNESDYATGGLVGKNSGTLKNTYAAGSVTGFDYVGGVVGANYGSVSKSVSLNSEITSYNDYAARFGGNNNARNISSDNHSWEGIRAGHSTWASHGDHATLQQNSALNNESSFRTLMGWDFDNVWEWRTTGLRATSEKAFPALRKIAKQENPLSDDFFGMLTVVDNIESSGITLRVGPNPTDGMLGVISSVPLGLYSLYTLQGATAMTGDASGENEITLDLAGLSSGLYILRISTAEGVESIHKIIKK